jgi:hypothetical protein
MTSSPAVTSTLDSMFNLITRSHIGNGHQMPLVLVLLESSVRIFLLLFVAGGRKGIFGIDACLI